MSDLVLRNLLRNAEMRLAASNLYYITVLLSILELPTVGCIYKEMFKTYV